MSMNSEGKPQPVDEKGGAAENLKRFGPVGILAVVALLFILQNTDKAHFEFLWYDLDWPMWVMLALTLVIGFFIGWFTHLRRIRRRRRD